MIFANYLKCAVLFHTILAIPLENVNVPILREVNQNYFKNIDGYPGAFSQETFNIPKSENINAKNIVKTYPKQEIRAPKDSINVDNVELLKNNLGNTKNQQFVQYEMLESPDPYHNIKLSNMKAPALPMNMLPQLVQNINRPKEQIPGGRIVEYEQVLDPGIQNWPRPRLNEIQSKPLQATEVRIPELLQQDVGMASPSYHSSLRGQPENQLMNRISLPMLDNSNTRNIDNLYPINQMGISGDGINLNTDSVNLQENTEEYERTRSEQAGHFNIVSPSDQNINLNNMKTVEAMKNIYLQLLQHINKPKEPTSVSTVDYKQFLNPGYESWSPSKLNEETSTVQPLLTDRNVFHEVLKPKKKRYTVIHPNGTIEYTDHLDLNNYPNHLIVNSGDIANFANIYDENINNSTTTSKSLVTNSQKDSSEIDDSNTINLVPLNKQSQIGEKSNLDYTKINNIVTDLAVNNGTKYHNSKGQDKNTIKNIGNNMPLINKNEVHSATVTSNTKNNTNDINNNFISTTIQITNSDKTILNEASMSNNTFPDKTLQNNNNIVTDLNLDSPNVSKSTNQQNCSSEEETFTVTNSESRVPNNSPLQNKLNNNTSSVNKENTFNNASEAVFVESTLTSVTPSIIESNVLVRNTSTLNVSSIEIKSNEDFKTISIANNQSSINDKIFISTTMSPSNVSDDFSNQNNNVNNITSTEVKTNDTEGKINLPKSEKDENIIEESLNNFEDQHEIENSTSVVEDSDEDEDEDDKEVSSVDVDSEDKFWQALFGDDEEENVYFIFYNQKKPIVETDTKTTIYPNGTVVKEITEIRNSDDGERNIKVTTTIEYPNGITEADEI